MIIDQMTKYVVSDAEKGRFSKNAFCLAKPILSQTHRIGAYTCDPDDDAVGDGGGDGKGDGTACTLFLGCFMWNLLYHLPGFDP